MNNLIREFDHFGLTPQFLISGENKYKSKVGGFTFFSFFMFAIYYFVSQSYSFFLQMNDVDNSRELLAYSDNYNLTSTEFYFGIGFIDGTNTEYNMSMFPYFNYEMYFVNKDINGTKTKTPIPFTACDVNLFLDQDSFSDYPNQEINSINNKTKYYLCPISNFTVPLQPNYFGERQSILQININFTNTSILSDVKEQLNQLRPRLNFIYKNFYIDTEDKYNPFTRTIDSMYSEIDYQISKKIDLSVDPMEIYDDDNIFGNIKYSPIKTNSSTQPNSTTFKISYTSNQIGIYDNRTQNLKFNNYEPFLNFFKIRILLNPNVKLTYRSYKKFASFLAEVTSILSNLLMICSIIMIKYNSIQGKNNMIMSLFTHNSIKNLKSFKDDSKPIFEERNKYIQLHQEKKINNLVRVSAIDISLCAPFVEESNLLFIYS